MALPIKSKGVPNLNLQIFHFVLPHISLYTIHLLYDVNLPFFARANDNLGFFSCVHSSNFDFEYQSHFGITCGELVPPRPLD